jgi:hypothetical protein
MDPGLAVLYSVNFPISTQFKKLCLDFLVITMGGSILLSLPLLQVKNFSFFFKSSDCFPAPNFKYLEENMPSEVVFLGANDF